MKKLIFGASLLLIAVGFSSCAKVASPETFEFDLTSADFSAVGTSGTSNYLYAASHSLSAITADVMNTGAVLGYVKLGGTQWAALPYTETYSGYTIVYGYQYEAGTVYITRKDSDLLTGVPGSMTIKIVVLTQKNMEMLEGVDKTNYEEVSKTLGL